jgi:hypothetical protein
VHYLLRKKVDSSYGKTAMIAPSQGVREGGGIWL